VLVQQVKASTANLIMLQPLTTSAVAVAALEPMEAWAITQ
jgi:hypothetical protein